MGNQLTSEQAELYRRVDEVLHYIWDPIGVSRVPEARHEYGAYAPHVFSLLTHHAPEAEIIAFLVRTETETMGLSTSPRTREHTAEVVSVLVEYRDALLARREG